MENYRIMTRVLNNEVSRLYKSAVAFVGMNKSKLDATAVGVANGLVAGLFELQSDMAKTLDNYIQGMDAQNSIIKEASYWSFNVFVSVFHSKVDELHVLLKGGDFSEQGNTEAELEKIN